MTVLSIPNGWLRARPSSESVVALGVLFIVGLLVVPIPSELLDLLLVVDLAAAMLVLLVALSIEQPIQFSVLPTLLLVATMFRIGLNLASTRLILVQADAGKVIEAFGSFVIGGNPVVGVIIFLILLVVQFVVITNGSGRIAEVAARFTLDSLPGKQQAIDSEVASGRIDATEASRRRLTLQQEADFYGAMDGAGRFVKGDAIASLLIVGINIVGGLVIGIAQLNIPLDRAVETYTQLTIGDGLVTQIPALLISLATGIVVTRAANSGPLADDLLGQTLGNSGLLGGVGVTLCALALFPSMPFVPLLVVGGALAATAYLTRSKPEPGSSEVAGPVVGDREGLVGLLAIELLEIEIGYGLIRLLRDDHPGGLLARIATLRRQFALDLGLIVPAVRIRDNLALQANTYVIRIRGVEVDRGKLLPNHLLATRAEVGPDLIGGITARPQTAERTAIWIVSGERDRAERLGYHVTDSAAALADHLADCISRYAPELLGWQEVDSLLNQARQDARSLVDEVVPGLLSVAEMQQVLQLLIAESVSIRDVTSILESLARRARRAESPFALAEGIRQDLGRAICQRLCRSDGVLRVLTLDPALDHELAASLSTGSAEPVITADPSLIEVVVRQLTRSVESRHDEPAVIVCSAALRRPLWRELSRSLAGITVLSYGEIPSSVSVESAGVVGGEPVTA